MNIFLGHFNFAYFHVDSCHTSDAKLSSDHGELRTDEDIFHFLRQFTKQEPIDEVAVWNS